MGGFAWVTLATNDSYSLGALVLAHSLKQSGTSQDLVVLVTPGVTNSMRQKLSSVFTAVVEVNILDSKDETNLRLLKRPELGVTFTKLHCWRLTQYEKCVFLDADTLVLQNSDVLFEREELSAAHDVGWPDCFNSGVFVYRPSNETYEKLIKFALEKGSFDGGDQGLLNLYFSDWATKDISKHLPFIYNLCSTACYSYLPAFKQFGADAKIVHFIGATKPWLQYFNTETRKVQPSGEAGHLENVLQLWWDIFCNLIYPNLTPDMARSTPSTSTTNYSFHESPQIELVFDDPWNYYFEEEKPIESHYTNACDIANHDIPVHFDSPSNQLKSLESKIPLDNPNPIVHTEPIVHIELIQPIQPFVLKPIVHIEPIQPVEPIVHEPIQPLEYVHTEPIVHIEPIQPIKHIEQITVESSLPVNPTPQIEPIPVLSTECEAPAAVCTETTLHAPEEAPNDAGLAGAFATLTLGAPRSAEQSQLDDHLRRQGWEVGNIDYLGKDSFENIWSKICETLSTPAPEPDKSDLAVAAPAPIAPPPSEQPVKLSEILNAPTPVSQTPVTPEPVLPPAPVSEAPIVAEGTVKVEAAPGAKTPEVQLPGSKTAQVVTALLPEVPPAQPDASPISPEVVQTQVAASETVAKPREVVSTPEQPKVSTATPAEATVTVSKSPTLEQPILATPTLVEAIVRDPIVAVPAPEEIKVATPTPVEPVAAVPKCVDVVSTPDEVKVTTPTLVAAVVTAPKAVDVVSAPEEVKAATPTPVGSVAAVPKTIDVVSSPEVKVATPTPIEPVATAPKAVTTAEQQKVVTPVLATPVTQAPEVVPTLEQAKVAIPVQAGAQISPEVVPSSEQPKVTTPKTPEVTTTKQEVISTAVEPQVAKTPEVQAKQPEVAASVPKTTEVTPEQPKVGKPVSEQPVVTPVTAEAVPSAVETKQVQEKQKEGKKSPEKKTTDKGKAVTPPKEKEASVATPESEKKSPEKGKKSPEKQTEEAEGGKQEDVEQAAPTPPPRKGSGGGKKSGKSKK